MKQVLLLLLNYYYHHFANEKMRFRMVLCLVCAEARTHTANSRVCALSQYALFIVIK